MDVRMGCPAGERAFVELPQHLTPAGIGWRFSELACEQIVALICVKGARPLTLTYRRYCRACGRTPGASGQRRSNQQGWVPPGSDETRAGCVQPRGAGGTDKPLGETRTRLAAASGLRLFEVAKVLLSDANWQLAIRRSGKEEDRGEAGR